MSNTSQTRAGSARHHTVDRRFVGLLAEDFGVNQGTILKALEGEPQREAIAITEWSSTCTDPVGALLAWAKKHRKGGFRKARRDRTAAETRAELNRRAEAVA